MISREISGAIWEGVQTVAVIVQLGQRTEDSEEVDRADPTAGRRRPSITHLVAITYLAGTPGPGSEAFMTSAMFQLYFRWAICLISYIELAQKDSQHPICQTLFQLQMIFNIFKLALFIICRTVVHEFANVPLHFT